jgi:hypothetical protein
MFGEQKTKKSAKATAAPNDQFLDELNEEIQPAENLAENNPGAEALAAVPGVTQPPFAPADEIAANSADVDAMFAELDGANPGEFEDLSAEILKFDGWKVNEARDYVLLKRTQFTDNETGEQKPAVQLRDREGNYFICAATTVVSAGNKLSRIPAPVRLVYCGKPVGKKYHLVKVFSPMEKA